MCRVGLVVPHEGLLAARTGYLGPVGNQKGLTSDSIRFVHCDGNDFCPTMSRQGHCEGYAVDRTREHLEA